MGGRTKIAQVKYATALNIIGVLGITGVVWYVVCFAMGNKLLAVPGIALFSLSAVVLIAYPRIRSSRGINTLLHAEDRVLEARHRFDLIGAKASSVEASLVAAEKIVAQIDEKGSASEELVEELVALAALVHGQLNDLEAEGAQTHAK